MINGKLNLLKSLPSTTPSRNIVHVSIQQLLNLFTNFWELHFIPHLLFAASEFLINQTQKNLVLNLCFNTRKHEEFICKYL